jgi:molybdopterin-guanine dinucleotide biosynthesis protein B
LIQDVDLILSEGFKKDVQPKIEVFRKEKHQDLLCTLADQLVAVASNRKFDIDVPCFDLEDMKGLADFIEKKFLTSTSHPEVSLKVDGKTISLTPFVRDFLSKTIKGMLSALKGCETSQRIEIHMEDK